MARGRSRSMKREVQNASKTLLANIRFASVDSPISSLVVTSSVPNEGKSTIAVNLAEAIAESGRSVLLVDCDFRNRSLARMLGVHAQSGLYAVLSQEVSLDEAVVSTSVANMHLLDVEPRIPNPADILSSKRFQRLTGKLEDCFDYVIYDTPPVGAFVDAAILSEFVDATLLVVRENFVKRDAVLGAADQLRKAGANIVGVVMNWCEPTSSGYYYYSYYAQANEDECDGTVPDSDLLVPADSNFVSGKHGTSARKRKHRS